MNYDDYDFEIDGIIENIRKKKAKKVLLQLPEGLKPFALRIVDEVEEKTKATCFIWFGSCYGACDLPVLPIADKIDLVVQFGHSRFGF